MQLYSDFSHCSLHHRGDATEIGYPFQCANSLQHFARLQFKVCTLLLCASRATSRWSLLRGTEHFNSQHSGAPRCQGPMLPPDQMGSRWGGTPLRASWRSPGKCGSNQLSYQPQEQTSATAAKERPKLGKPEHFQQNSNSASPQTELWGHSLS